MKPPKLCSLQLNITLQKNIKHHFKLKKTNQIYFMTHICLYTFGVKDNYTPFTILYLKFTSTVFSDYDKLLWDGTPCSSI